MGLTYRCMHLQDSTNITHTYIHTYIMYIYTCMHAYIVHTYINTYICRGVGDWGAQDTPYFLQTVSEVEISD